jgi:hypothetical protein
MSFSGFLFLFIIITFLASGAFFYKYGDVDSDDRLKKINMKFNYLTPMRPGLVAKR